MKKRLLYLIFVTLFVLTISCAENTSTNCECINPLLDSSATVVISYVTDGDTYKFGIKSDTVTIRLLHVDCYEVRNTQRLRDQAAGKGISVDSALALGYAGRDFTTQFLLNKKAFVRRDFNEPNMDSFGRLLRHVYVGGVSIADTLRALGLVYEE